ncbi:hypothetical protein QJS10_CPA01g01599 [Acorus calamus]|uniref:Uncharacterized protein n=1 Tax=Acorus calamus TaxID=4465 RepID=A0AAV9FI15_ACOCL|nr:hypothetical protein QJS10_CPA01g01599 [Acorus calamus]
MTVSPPMAFLSIPISITLIFFFFFTSSITQTLSASNNTCPSYPDCGDIQIRYPFWLNSSTTTTTTRSTTSYCGYPGFGLTCGQSNNKKLPILHLPNDDYYVTNIEYEALTVTLVDIDVYNQPCPRPRHNFTFDHYMNFFEYTSKDQKLTFLFNCSTPHIPLIDIFQIQTAPLTCLQNSYVIPDDLFLKNTDWHIYCQEAVMLPALNDSVNLSDLQNHFGDVLNLGVELNWVSETNCTACEKSRGSCLYENKQGIKFTGCLCGDGLQALNCRDMPTFNKLREHQHPIPLLAKLFNHQHLLL